MGRRITFSLLALGPLEPWVRRACLWITHGVSPRVIGRHHVPRSGPCLIVASHRGRAEMDQLATAAGRHFHIVAAEENAHLPLIGPSLLVRGLLSLRGVEVGGDESNLATLEQAGRLLREGERVALFPQGRSDRIGGGAARIAALGGAPVLPVLTYCHWPERGRPRALVLVRRSWLPPADDPRARREFTHRIRRRFHVMGCLRPDEPEARILSVLLDDPRWWRNPLSVPRLEGRVRRLPPDRRRTAERAAKALLLGCARLRCSITDVRRPPGVGDAALWLLLLPFALTGLLLFAPPLIYLHRRSRGLRPDYMKPVARCHGLGLLLVPWLLLLGLAGVWTIGVAGLLIPVVALAGMVAHGFARPLRKRVRATFRVRRHGHRLAPLIGRVEQAVLDQPPTSRRTPHASQPA